MASNPNSPFTSMEMTFKTGPLNGDGKDGNTRLELFILTGPIGAPAVAYYNNDPAWDQDNDPIDPGTTVTRVVMPSPVGSPGFPLSKVLNNKIDIKITAHGNDTWKFSFVAKLNFADGSIATVTSVDLVIDQDARELLYPLSGAVITAPSVVSAA